MALVPEEYADDAYVALMVMKAYNMTVVHRNSVSHIHRNKLHQTSFESSLAQEGQYLLLLRPVQRMVRIILAFEINNLIWPRGKVFQRVGESRNRARSYS